jgi:hypothetical protein
MNLMWRALFVVAGIVVGSTAINIVLGNSGDYLPGSARVGDWRNALVRTACYDALAIPEQAPGAPPRPTAPHRIDYQDYRRAVELAAALNCYLVTQTGAVCERNNRAYIVDYIGKYFDKMDAMLSTAARHGDDEVRYVKAMWNSQNNRSIAAALDDQIRNGRLNKSDFGWSVPAPLKAQLAASANAPDKCANQRPWVATKL